eukprot:m.132887 g.132887  ORF g.132887 m.132887 type:complete len:394 (-) comp14655_c0_seq4:222-1403(-)
MKWIMPNSHEKESDNAEKEEAKERKDSEASSLADIYGPSFSADSENQWTFLLDCPVVAKISLPDLYPCVGRPTVYLELRDEDVGNHNDAPSIEKLQDTVDELLESSVEGEEMVFSIISTLLTELSTLSKTSENDKNLNSSSWSKKIEKRKQHLDQTNNNPIIAYMTEDVLLLIFAYLTYKDLLQCSLVCWHWRWVVNKESRVRETLKDYLGYRIGISCYVGRERIGNLGFLAALKKQPSRLRFKYWRIKCPKDGALYCYVGSSAHVWRDCPSCSRLGTPPKPILFEKHVTIRSCQHPSPAAHIESSRSVYHSKRVSPPSGSFVVWIEQALLLSFDCGDSFPSRRFLLTPDGSIYASREFDKDAFVKWKTHEPKWMELQERLDLSQTKHRVVRK